MDKIKVAKELVKLAQQITANSDIERLLEKTSNLHSSDPKERTNIAKELVEKYGGISGALKLVNSAKKVADINEEKAHNSQIVIDHILTILQKAAMGEYEL